MPTVAVIPIRSFAFGNRRLESAISPQERAALGAAMAERVASVAGEAGLIPLIVTSDPEVAAWAVPAGFGSIDDTGNGLDAAVAAGVRWAAAAGSGWLAIHADLPLVTATELAELDEHLQAGNQPIAPSADGGTTALGSQDPVRTSYGTASFRRHLARLNRPRVVVSTGLLLDVDRPRDLAAAASLPAGRWLLERR